MSDREQRFTFGYHLNSWDLGGLNLEEGLRSIAGAGFPWFEALARDGYSNDFARRFMRVGEAEPPEFTSDTAFLSRIALFSHIQEQLGLRLSSLYCNAELINSRTWRGERDSLAAIARLLHGFGAPGLVIGRTRRVTTRRSRARWERSASSSANSGCGPPTTRIWIPSSRPASSSTC
jgi:inosose dehydratase